MKGQRTDDTVSLLFLARLLLMFHLCRLFSTPLPSLQPGQLPFFYCFSFLFFFWKPTESLIFHPFSNPWSSFVIVVFVFIIVNPYIILHLPLATCHMPHATICHLMSLRLKHFSHIYIHYIQPELGAISFRSWLRIGWKQGCLNQGAMRGGDREQ